MYLFLLNSDYSSATSDTQKAFCKNKGESAGIPSFDVVINESYIDGIYIDGTLGGAGHSLEIAKNYHQKVY